MEMAKDFESRAGLWLQRCGGIPRHPHKLSPRLDVGAAAEIDRNKVDAVNMDNNEVARGRTLGWAVAVELMTGLYSKSYGSELNSTEKSSCPFLTSGSSMRRDEMKNSMKK